LESRKRKGQPKRRRRPRRNARRDFESLLADLKWHAFHVSFTIVLLAWLGAAVIHEVRSQLGTVIAASEQRPRAQVPADLRDGGIPVPSQK
jgi:hypothetical protein